MHTPQLYQHITDQIIAAIESGKANQPWRMPWHTTGAAIYSPINAISRKPYRGVNTLILWAADAKGYAAGTWATYEQWQDLGAQVRRGEKTSTIVFWKVTEGKNTESEEEAAETEKRFFARAYYVFNADQVEGYPAPAVPQMNDQERIMQAERFFAQLDAQVLHGGNQACYVPPRDHIRMPDFAQFRDAVSYYATLAYECIYWTGHPTRCNRDLTGRFGDAAYAAEALIAELGAAFLCGNLQMSVAPRDDHAVYINTWLKVLRADPRAIFTTASKAQQAVDWRQARQQACQWAA
jgi:antirestriction protein ArdC